MNNDRETTIIRVRKALSSPPGVNYETRNAIKDDRVNRSHFFSSAHEKVLYEPKKTAQGRYSLY